MTTIRGLSSDQFWDFENGYFWFSEPKRLLKTIAQYEIYRHVTGLAGDVFELGVYKAASLLRLATYRNALETPHSRRIVGFDAFGAFPTAGAETGDDAAFIERFEAAGGDGLSVDEIQKLLDEKGQSENVSLVPGDVRETLPAYFEREPQTRIALLHLDMDVYEPTLFALEQCWARMPRGGVVMIDDYNAVAGATRAVDDFFRGAVEMRKSPLSHVPAYIIKD